MNEFANEFAFFGGIFGNNAKLCLLQSWFPAQAPWWLPQEVLLLHSRTTGSQISLHVTLEGFIVPVCWLYASLCLCLSVDRSLMTSVSSGLCGLLTANIAPSVSPSCTTVWPWPWRPAYYHPGTQNPTPGEVWTSNRDKGTGCPRYR